VIVGIGVDIVEISRLRRTLERRGERFIRRIYTEGEREYCWAHRDPAPCFAARFAAKEALFKALRTGWTQGVTWLDVEVRRDERGAPSLMLSGRAGDLSRELGVRAIHVSLSHSEEAAIALVILEN
jgi:holo-[acyl-carrier protein] synthase